MSCESCKKCKEAAEGWTSLTLHLAGRLDAKTIDLVNSRRKICDNCDELKKSSIGFFTCNQCGCFYPMLAYAKNKQCPLGKW